MSPAAVGGMAGAATLVRPRISSFLRVALHDESPTDVDRAYLERADRFGLRANGASATTTDTFWDEFQEAARREGRAGGALKGDVRDAYNRFVRLAGQLAGEEGALDSATAILYDLLAGAQRGSGGSNARGEFEKVVHRKLKDEEWQSAVQLVGKLCEWMSSTRQVKKGSAKPCVDGPDEGAGAMWGSHFTFHEGLAAGLPEASGDKEEEDSVHVCHGMDTLDDRDAVRDEEPVLVPLHVAEPEHTRERVDGSSLFTRCEEHLRHTPGGMGMADLGNAVVNILNKAKDEVELQTGLFELLGEKGFEFMMWIIEHRTKLRRVKPREIKRRAEAPPETSSQAPVRRPPTVGATVTIQTEEEKRLEKERRKAVRQGRRQPHAQDPTASADRADGHDNGAWEVMSNEIDWVEILGFDLKELEERQKPQQERELLPEGSTGLYDRPKGLPAGTKKIYKPGYEEVRIPPPKVSGLKAGEKLIEVATALDDWALPAFKGIKRLNRIQSIVFEAAYKSQENLLICAPTGAGKTNIAMLALLALVRDYVKGGQVVDKSLLKAIYVAPMKALAQEVVSKFSERLKALGLTVRELTGDMQLTKKEIEESQLIVTTPEKWDVVTRKGGEGSLASIVGLIMIDEVHLLADERGAVIESIVARTQRQVETSQRTMRLVGLSATLPNYKDVALFLRAPPKRGLFYFGPEYRPVPLEQTFIGVTEKQRLKQLNVMTDLAYAKALDAIRGGHQVMVFVHSRKDTTRTAQAIRDKAAKEGTLGEFSCVSSDAFTRYVPLAAKSRNADLRQHFDGGFGIHHAGMLRPDRSLTERMFEDGAIKVLCCTATLAWGINLPAHSVIIKGTEVYNAEKGGFTDLSMLDVMQIFGRAGRPQYDTSGEATLITTHKALPRYLALLTEQTPIESSFIKQLPDHLNAEVVSGTVTNVREGVAWLSYTYLYIRMLKNPMVYGITYEEAARDPMLDAKRLQLITDAAKILDQNRMVRYDPRSGNLAVTDMGRTASHYYIRHESIEQFNGLLYDAMSEADALNVLCAAREFEEVKVRSEELDEIDRLKRQACRFEVMAPVEESAGKANVLLQSYVSQARLTGFTVISDTNYVAQNAGRVGRALFEACLRKGWVTLATIFLKLCKSVDRRVWWDQCPLRQFDTLSYDVIRRLEEKSAKVSQLLDMTDGEVGDLVHNMRSGRLVRNLAQQLPSLKIEAAIQPITRGILKVTLHITATFQWSDRWHGSVEPWWIWVEDAMNERVYHSEAWLLHKKQKDEVHVLAFTIPIFEPLPPQYTVRAVSDRWVGCEYAVAVSFKHLILPDRHPPHTDLLDLAPLPKSALNHEGFEALYRFAYFNPIQTQIFHAIYHTDTNILVGAPTGSGKTLIAELAILRLLRTQHKAKTVYIAPLKALARERLKEWRQKLGEGLGLVVLELSGDVTPDIQALNRADIIVATPEKWDGITRSWKRRDYVGNVRLVVMDEIHLLGEDRGPVLEVIVSRMRYISSQTGRDVRFLGLSTALANPKDLADWLGVEREGLFNFRPSVRPIPMDVHVSGFPGKHYCPRMATMNKPTYAAIMEHSPDKPVLVFVSSRRQTRLTALELISLCAQGENPKQFLHMPEDEAQDTSVTLRDPALRHTLVFGIGIHHAGLDDHDRMTVEELFVSGKIQVLVCTSTLAWGVNFPAHLVVIKGTEYFDGKTGRYVDFPVTDILQMMGRAGRPQFDTHGVACILVHEPKKNFIRKFLYEPFPVESSLKSVLHNHMKAEIAGGAIKSKQDAVEYLTWTFFFRRLIMNPTYYHLEDTSPEGVQHYLLDLIDATLEDLRVAGCIEVEDDFLVKATVLSYIASYYYLDYRSVALIRNTLDQSPDADTEAIVGLLAEAQEYAELPVRHNEDLLNTQLAQSLSCSVQGWDMGSSHTKAFLLLQAHFEHAPLPIADYANDTKSVLDQAPRILNAMVDTAADLGLLQAALCTMHVSQMVVRGCTERTHALAQLPSLTEEDVKALHRFGIQDLRSLLELEDSRLRSICHKAKVDANRLLSEARRVSWVSLANVRVLEEEGGPEVERDSTGAFVIETERDYVLEVALACRTARGPPLASGRYTKAMKEGGWWLALGVESRDVPRSPADDELLALKRLSMPRGGGAHVRKSSVALTFSMNPEDEGNASVVLHVVSDVYRGLDSRADIPLVVLAPQAGEQDGLAIDGADEQDCAEQS